MRLPPEIGTFCGLLVPFPVSSTRYSSPSDCRLKKKVSLFGRLCYCHQPSPGLASSNFRSVPSLQKFPLQKRVQDQVWKPSRNLPAFCKYPVLFLQTRSNYYSKNFLIPKRRNFNFLTPSLPRKPISARPENSSISPWRLAPELCCGQSRNTLRGSTRTHCADPRKHAARTAETG